MILMAAVEIAEDDGYEHGSDDYRLAIMDALRATNLDGVTGHITYDQYNNPIKSAFMIEIRDGEARFWGKY
jgi:branched-chain amino acid transport system substrate-binding protein